MTRLSQNGATSRRSTCSRCCASRRLAKLAKSAKSLEASGLPSREALIAFLKSDDAPDRATKRDIAKAFGVRGDARRALKDMIRALKEEGALDGGRKGLKAAGQTPRLMPARIVERARDGGLIALTENDDGSAGMRVRIAEKAQKTRGRTKAPGIGARVLVRVAAQEGERGATLYAGRIVKLLERSAPRLLAVFRRLSNGAARAAPVDKRERQREIDVPRGQDGGAEDGDLVRLEVLRGGRAGATAARVVERLGAVNSPRTVSLIAIAAHGVPDEFPEATLAEAARASAVALGRREDWRELPLVTIDPADARDHDDAVHARPDDDAANPGGHVLTVAIADVAAYVRPDSAMDVEAERRGNSVYLPDRVVPMLPERISNDLCSLRPSEDRAALAIRWSISADGRKRGHSVHRVLMRSVAKLTYQQAQRAFDGRPDDSTRPISISVLRPLFAAYEALRKERDARAPLDLDIKERKLVLDEDGDLVRVDWPERLEAHRLIEEFMIQANVAAAEELEAKGTPLLYRVHDSPSDAKVEDVREFLRSLDLGLTRGETLKARHFNRALQRASGRADEALVNETILRAQAQAEYAPGNYGHFGLNLRRYAHFTSPIRRYADLVVHRALIRALKLGDDGLPDMSLRRLEELGEHLSRAERRAMAAERDTADRIVAAYMSAHIGATFAARVSGVVNAGLFVRLKDTGADGFVPASTMGHGRRNYDAGRHLLESGGAAYRLGDDIMVKLVEAAPVAGALRFEVVADAEERRRPTVRRHARRPR